MNKQSIFLNTISVLFGILFSIIGMINIFWGNDSFYGLFILGLSLVFYPPLGERFTKLTGMKITGWMKILIGFFIIWSAVGVGELFDKVDLMLASFN